MLSCCLLTSPSRTPVYSSFVPKEGTELLWGAYNFKRSLMKLSTPARKAENCNSGQSEPCFPILAAMHEANHFPIRDFQSLVLVL